MKLFSIIKYSPASSLPMAQNPTPLFKSPVKREFKERMLHSDELKHCKASEIHMFNERHDTSPVELFYDLFFVANLATYTANHEIVDWKSLRNYVGFFTLLWFTWLETSLFDIRFASDCVIERLFKAFSFGVMTGFASCGVLYDVTKVAENHTAFRSMALVLMVSRLLLSAQYALVLRDAKCLRRAFYPLLGTSAVHFLTAIAFLVTFFYFPSTGHSKAYWAWYGFAIFEAILVAWISCNYRVISFRNTPVVERFRLLTLIIMGEGIIGITKSVTQILQNSKSASGDDIGAVIASVLLIYFLYMLYIDQIWRDRDHFGTIRLSVWAVLHFGLHVAILLTVEGSSTLILWNICVQFVTYWRNLMTPCVVTDWSSDVEVISCVQGAIDKLTNRLKIEDLTQKYNYTQLYTAITELDFNSTGGFNETLELVNEIYFGIDSVIFEIFGIHGPEKREKSNWLEELNAELHVFKTVFIFFYIAAGCFLMILAVLYWVGKKQKAVGDYISMCVRIVVGTGIIFTILAYWFPRATEGSNFLFSPWIIPVAMFGYFIVIVLDNLIIRITNRRVKRGSLNRHPSDHAWPRWIQESEGCDYPALKHSSQSHAQNEVGLAF